MINDPELVFLDELTTGLDPQARRAIWGLVTGIRDRGKTVFLTTHLMEEAERLCDRVAIIEHGKVIEMDSPAALVNKHCPERAVVVSSAQDGVGDRFAPVGGILGGERVPSALQRILAGDHLVVMRLRRIRPLAD